MLICGLIAYMGDALGRRMGKKRLTVFGLRPKRTAVLVTTLTGCFIFTVTLGSVITLSKEHREWVLRGVETVRDLETRKAELREKTTELRRLTTELEQTTEELDNLRAAIRDANRALETAKNSLREAESDRRRIERSLHLATRQQAALRARNETIEKHLDAAQRNLAATTQDLHARSAEVRELTAQREKLSADVQALSGQLTTYREETDTLAKQNEVLARENLALEKDREQLQRTRSELQGEVADLTSRLGMLGAELTAATGAFGRTAIKFRTEPILFPIGREVARLPVTGGGDIADNVLKIRSLLDRAREVAKQEGASPGPDGDYVTMLDSFALSDQGHLVRIPVEKVTEAMAEALVNTPGDTVLIASAAVNTVAGEPLVVGLEILPNPVVFHAGETVASVQLDNQHTDEQLMGELVQFLRDDLATTARERGMVPIAGRGETIGEVTYGTLLDLIKRIRKAGKMVNVTAVAKSETRAADRLELLFGVNRL
ncbi:MAG: DUF3084 domain-containing protein [Fimbriimonadia bacterium]